MYSFRCAKHLFLHSSYINGTRCHLEDLSGSNFSLFFVVFPSTITFIGNKFGYNSPLMRLCELCYFYYFIVHAEILLSDCFCLLVVSIHIKVRDLLSTLLILICREIYLKTIWIDTSNI